ncbi:hypothetical protein DFH09DRAFT_1187239 [Mycena vulgaris]|nr:hypothetical protein DFH09DRAFT_1187239 [Mycena vulgaris]
MPHPSIPLDDFRAHSFNREHGLARAGSRGRLVSPLLVPARASRCEISESSVCLMEFLVNYGYCITLQCILDSCFRLSTNRNPRFDRQARTVWSVLYYSQTAHNA